MKEKKLFFRKMLHAVRMTAVHGANMASLLGSFEEKVPEKLRGGVEEQRINDALKTEYLAVGCITVVMAIAMVITRL